MVDLQATCNTTQVCVRTSLGKEVYLFNKGSLTPRRTHLKALAEAKLVKYKSQAFGCDGALYHKAKDAAYAFNGHHLLGLNTLVSILGSVLLAVAASVVNFLYQMMNKIG